MLELEVATDLLCPLIFCLDPPMDTAYEATTPVFRKVLSSNSSTRRGSPSWALERPFLDVLHEEQNREGTNSVRIPSKAQPMRASNIETLNFDVECHPAPVPAALPTSQRRRFFARIHDQRSEVSGRTPDLNPVPRDPLWLKVVSDAVQALCYSHHSVLSPQRYLYGSG